MIVLENLLEDIQRRKKKVDEQIERTSLVDRLLNLFKTSIDSEANMHSCRLEYSFGKENVKNNMKSAKDFETWYAQLKKDERLDDIDAAIELAEKIENEPSEEEKRALYESFKECYSNLRKAWKWGLSNFNLNFDEQFMIEIAKRVEPGVVNDYRKNWVRPTGAPVTPPAPEKVRREMGKLMKNIDNAKQYIQERKMNPVELAIMTHYHLARIHPFEDGNGRTSRLIQNLILNQYGYPATIIHKGDKMNYVMNLRKADEDHKWRDNKDDFINEISEGERHFYDYLASRVNTTFDLILDKAYKTHKRKVNIEGKT